MTILTSDEANRVRIGLVLPSVNTVVEPLFASVLPDKVSVHAARMFLAPDLTPKSIIEMDERDGGQAIRQIASCRPRTIAYCCTASSVVQGQVYDARLRKRIEEETGARATTATHSILAALKKFGASRICIASPYTDELDRLEHQFFKDQGLTLVHSANLGICDTFKLADPDASTLNELCRRAWKPESDALVITCLNTKSHLVVNSMEKEIGKPVITSTMATLWNCLRLSGIEDYIRGSGMLFRQ